MNQLGEFGYTPSDVQIFSGRMLRYLVTCPLRREAELENVSAYDFFVGKDATGARRFVYSPQFEALILDMPKVLAAFDSRWGDARTNLTTFLQLQLRWTAGHQGRRCAQRPHHRVLVRALVPASGPCSASGSSEAASGPRTARWTAIASHRHLRPRSTGEYWPTAPGWPRTTW